MQNQCKLTLPGADAVTIKARLERDLDEAERKAHRNLARYKFNNFGYWAAIWVHLNRVGQFQRPNPFVDYVKLAGTKNTVTRKGVNNIESEGETEPHGQAQEVSPKEER